MEIFVKEGIVQAVYSDKYHGSVWQEMGCQSFYVEGHVSKIPCTVGDRVAIAEGVLQVLERSPSPGPDPGAVRVRELLSKDREVGLTHEEEHELARLMRRKA